MSLTVLFPLSICLANLPKEGPTNPNHCPLMFPKVVYFHLYLHMLYIFGVYSM